jgi:hypothetical protein
MYRPSKKLPRSVKERAQTMVEFALVFPILLLITYGIMEFGRMIFIYASITGGAREGARYGASTSNYKNCDGIRDAVRRMSFLIPDSAVDITITYDAGPLSWTTPTNPPPDHPPEPAAIASCNPGYSGSDVVRGNRIVVHVSTQYQPIINFLNLSPFQIDSLNARTIVRDVEVDRP